MAAPNDVFLGVLGHEGGVSRAVKRALRTRSVSQDKSVCSADQEGDEGECSCGVLQCRLRHALQYGLQERISDQPSLQPVHNCKVQWDSRVKSDTSI